MTDNVSKSIRLRMPLAEVCKRLNTQIDKGRRIRPAYWNNEAGLKLVIRDTQLWFDYTKELLAKLFSTDALQQEFVSSGGPHTVMLRTLEERIRDHHHRLDNRIAALVSILERSELFEEEGAAVAGRTASVAVQSVDRRKVFVVHGRDEHLRKAMFDFLRAIGLDPIEWSQAISSTGKASPTIGEILDGAFAQAQAIVVLLTGDDEAKLRGEFVQASDPAYEKELTPQARPNVLFEAGMAFGRSPERTVLVQVGQIRPWSDIAGKHLTHLDNSAPKRQELAVKLRTARCQVDTTGQDWLTCGEFEK